MKRIIQIVIYVGILFFASYNCNAQTHPLDKKIDTILEKYQVPGAAIALVNKDTVVYSGYFGKSDIKTGKSVNERTQFTIGSISKTFLALGTMKAQEQGKLNISKPLKEVIPSFNFTNEYNENQPLKLIHLLEHTSGFDEAHFDIFARTDSNTPLHTVLAQSQSALTTRWAPGSYYSYNTLNYIAAAYILEESVKGSFETFMTKHILNPLKMDVATYHPAENTHRAKGYASSLEEPFPNLPQWPAGSLTTNLKGMQNFTQLFLNEGTFKGNRLVEATSIQAMETPESSQLARNGVDFGYGKGLMQEFVGNDIFYGHNGSYGGFLSEFGYSKKQDIGYIILLNDRDASKAIKEIKKELLASYKVKPEPEPAIAPLNLEKFEGAYQPITFNVEVLYPFMRLIDLQIMNAEGSHLIQTSMMGGAVQWMPVADGIFKKDNEPQATTLFVDDNESTIWLGETSYHKISRMGAYIQFYLALLCVLIVIVSFFTLGILLIRKLILKRTITKGILVNFSAILFLVIAISGLLFLYDPEKLYSSGAIIYYLGSWLFLIVSVWSFYYFISILLKKARSGKLMRFHTGISSISCMIIASYLLYWGLIGLKLWNY
ncbi:beta-lactamase [Allomuricauda ruestringensis DSM 13258]|uniref:Beta-lactamase n=1 Tax=Allomuricauda ruestringensis (strain DSM 13258 / CIP 107369 / LMG 19739 / B1) TaxID=886377 RepID=G2PIU6_ALLRU|nr:serine hydrolase domain-containing protein [Allomuricauda ruestringensis]AEM70745.1 beta-lactamase [Allomuricauda ruestringensis DSM 13258]